MGSDRPLPLPSELTRPFWEGAKERRLLVQSCNHCGAKIMYPKRFCPSCLGDDLGWVESTGKGTVYTFTVQERGAPSGFGEQVPYVLAVVRLEEGVQLMSNVIGPGAEDVACGDPVEVDFEEIEDGAAVLPVFRLVEGASG